MCAEYYITWAVNQGRIQWHDWKVYNTCKGWEWHVWLAWTKCMSADACRHSYLKCCDTYAEHTSLVQWIVSTAHDQTLLLVRLKMWLLLDVQQAKAARNVKQEQSYFEEQEVEVASACKASLKASQQLWTGCVHRDIWRKDTCCKVQ